MTANRYRTTRDITIPAGTVLTPPPTASTRWRSDFEGVVTVDRDHSLYVTITPDEGIEAGYLEVDDG